MTSSPVIQARTVHLKRSLVALGALLGLEILLRNVLLPRPDSIDSRFLLIATGLEGLALAGLLGIWLPRVEHAGLSSVGFTSFRPRHVVLGIAAFVVVLILSGMFGVALEQVGLRGLRSLQPMLQRIDLSARIALFLAGTVFEEVVYRGYLIERVTLWTGRLWVGALASWVSFTAMHFGFFGLGPTLDTGILAGALVVLYARERSLWPCVVLHGLNGVLAYLVAPVLTS